MPELHSDLNRALSKAFVLNILGTLRRNMLLDSNADSHSAIKWRIMNPSFDSDTSLRHKAESNKAASHNYPQRIDSAVSTYYNAPQKKFGGTKCIIIAILLD